MSIFLFAKFAKNLCTRFIAIVNRRRNCMYVPFKSFKDTFLYADRSSVIEMGVTPLVLCWRYIKQNSKGFQKGGSVVMVT